MQYIFFLGHQPHLSLAEIEAKFGADSIQSFTSTCALLKLSKEPNIDFLGGTTKISEILKVEVLQQDYQTQIEKLVLNHLAEQKNEKLKLGLSIYSATKNIKLNKKFIQGTLENVRQTSKTRLPKLNLHTVDPKSAELNTAQIVHSGLLKQRGISLDILICRPGVGRDPINSTGESQIILSKTIQAPNLKKYTLRDYGKPKPSGVNGMLPPKLAQILLNLSKIKPNQTVLDPFCGSGTVLQEALLQNINAIGTDLNPKIIEDAQANLTWLQRKLPLPRERACPGLVPGVGVRGSQPIFKLYPADATSYTWPEQFDAIVCETYLGTPLSSEPSQAKLKCIIAECNQIAEKFLQNIQKQITNQTIVIALPCWFIQSKIIKLPVVEKLAALGYNQNKYSKVKEDLVYHRSGSSKKEKDQQRNQLVGRDIYILTKK